jgi:hypothetical protein
VNEYQYYGFLAVDRPLNAMTQNALRSICCEAQISETRFIAEYRYGRFRGDPIEWLTHWFDLHVYSGLWSSRQFVMRLPRRIGHRASIERFGIGREFMTVSEIRDSLLIAITLYDRDLDPGRDETAWLDELAPLRAAVLRGDYRMFYLLWLMQVGLDGVVGDDAPEPLAGIAPVTPELAALAAFLEIDPDLLAAAIDIPTGVQPTPQQTEAVIRSLSETEKVDWLTRLVTCDAPQLGAELRRRVIDTVAADGPGLTTHRSSGDLRETARHSARLREEQNARREADESDRQAGLEATLADERRAALAARGPAIWQEIEEAISRRTTAGYEQATGLLLEVRGILPDPDDFARRIADIRDRHVSKRNFMLRLDQAGLL